MSYMLILLFPFPRHPFIATEGFFSPHHLNPLSQELVIFCRCWTQHVSFWRHLCSGHSSQWLLLDQRPELLWLFFYVLTSLGKALGNTVPKWIWVLPHCFSHFNLSQYYEAYWILSNWSLFTFILFFLFFFFGGWCVKLKPLILFWG